MNDILRRVKELQHGEILELQTPFVPAPIIDMIRKKGYKLFSVKKNTDWVITYVSH